MAKLKYIIELTDEEKDTLKHIIADKSESERAVLRAKILLHSDAEYRGISVLKLAEQLGTNHTTIQTVRKAYVTQGLEGAVYRKKHEVSMTKRRINEDVRNEIRKIPEREIPRGYTKWSIRLICQTAIEEGLVNHISPATMMKILNEA